MSEWDQTTLGAHLNRVKRKVAVEDGVEYRAVSVTKDGAGLGQKQPFVGGITKYENLFRVVEGDVVVRTITAFESPAGVAHREHDGTHVSGVFLTYEVADDALPGFFELFFQTPMFWREMQDRATGTVLRRKTISDSAFCLIPVALPPLAEQGRIVDVMAAVDAQIKALEGEMGRLGSAYEALLRNVAESHDLQTIESVVAQAFAGGTPSRSRDEFYNGEIPWLKSGEVDNDQIGTAAEFITDAGLKGSSTKVVPSGATLVAMYGQGDTKGKAGFVASPVATNQAVLALIPDESVIDPRFLLHAVRSQTDALRARAIGAAQPNLSKGLVLSHEIPVPGTLAEQQVLANAADAISEVKSVLSSEHTHLRMFRSTLLTALLGQDIEIPASYNALLEATAS